MERCAKCQVKIRDGGYPTPMGERVCASCHDTVAGAVVGLGTGGGLGGALAGPGILRWVRESLHPEQRRERESREAQDVQEAREAQAAQDPADGPA